jgi:hypothetical protein
MEKAFIRSLLLLSLAAVFMACHREVPQNETYDPVTNSVTAQFVLNVSTGTGKDTKTTAEFAQVGTGAKFLGMDQVHLLTYALDDNNLSDAHSHFFFNPVVDGNAVAATRDFNLGALFAEGSVSDKSASRTVELSIPLATNAVALYGKATKTYDNYYQGSTIAAGDPADLTSLTFSLEPLLESQDRFDVGAFFFSTMFTYIAAAGLVNEQTFWRFPGGGDDKSYKFWWPIPTKEEEAELPANPADGTTATVGNVTFTHYKGQLSWKQLGTMALYHDDDVPDTDPDNFVKTEKGTPMALTPLGEVLGDAYYVLVTIKEDKDQGLKELRAGSASAILRVAGDLYSIVDRCATSVPTSWEENCVKLLAQEVKTRMSRFFTLFTTGLDFIRENDKPGGNIDIEALRRLTESATSSTRWNAIKDAFDKYFDDSYFYFTTQDEAGQAVMSFGFPQNVGIPYGAAIMGCEPSWDNQTIMPMFSYIQDIPAYGFGGTVTFPIQNYRYPPELMYYGNSSIRTTDEVKKAADFPYTVGNWGNEDLWGGWQKNSEVSSSTRSIAMVNNINYGTALLASTVKYADGITVLKDNNHALHPTEEDNDVPVVSGGGIQVTGVIIGGQADVMGWDFTRYPANGSYAAMSYDPETMKYEGTNFEGNGFDKMIYDRVVGGVKIGDNSIMYSFCWDNYNHDLPADDQSDVYIGLELYNNTGEDFWGEMNLIRNKGIFYLIGKMDLKEAVANARKGANVDAFKDLDRKYYCYPPFDPATGKTINAPRVFMQDYITTANLVLGEDALKHAYVTVPDLRASQVSLGLSIDMAWTPGLAFEVNMGHLENE